MHLRAVCGTPQSLTILSRVTSLEPLLNRTFVRKRILLKTVTHPSHFPSPTLLYISALSSVSRRRTSQPSRHRDHPFSRRPNANPFPTKDHKHREVALHHNINPTEFNESGATYDNYTLCSLKHPSDNQPDSTAETQPIKYQSHNKQPRARFHVSSNIQSEATRRLLVP